MRCKNQSKMLRGSRVGIQFREKVPMLDLYLVILWSHISLVLTAFCFVLGFGSHNTSCNLCRKCSKSSAQDSWPSHICARPGVTRLCVSSVKVTVTCWFVVVLSKQCEETVRKTTPLSWNCRFCGFVMELAFLESVLVWRHWFWVVMQFFQVSRFKL